jgi:hypothetical protein
VQTRRFNSRPRLQNLVQPDLRGREFRPFSNCAMEMITVTVFATFRQAFGTRKPPPDPQTLQEGRSAKRSSRENYESPSAVYHRHAVFQCEGTDESVRVTRVARASAAIV